MVSPNVVHAKDATLNEQMLDVLNDCLFMDAVSTRAAWGDPMEQQFLHLQTRANFYGDGYAMEILLCNPCTARVYYRASGDSIESTIAKFKHVLTHKERV